MNRKKSPDLNNLLGGKQPDSQTGEQPDAQASKRLNVQASERKKATLYIPANILKAFKQLALEQEREYSELATEAFADVLEKYKPDA